MNLNEVAQNESETSYINYVVWQIFTAERDRLRLRIAGMISLDISGTVEKWITNHFGPKPF